MKPIAYIRIASLVILLSTGGGGWADAAARPIRALMVAGGCCHDYEEQKGIVSAGISARANVEWTIVHEGGAVRDHKVSIYSNPNWADGYDVIVHNECYGAVEDVAFVETIAAAHESGVPAVMLHCSTHSYRTAKTDEWRKTLGLSSYSHEKRRDLNVVNLRPEHPVMKRFPAEWLDPEDELYKNEKIWPNFVPLAEAYGQDTQRNHVCIWLNTYGKARVFATTLGHQNSTMKDPVYLDLITRGLLWTVGKLEENGDPAAGYEAASNRDFKLKDGDNVVFYGDSITDQRLYTTFAETFVATRFPNLKIDFTHSGWGGDRVTGGGGGRIDTRLERDVFAYKPNVMTIMLGMNDASYRPFDDSIFTTYRDGYRHIVDSVKRELPGVRLTLIQPSPFDDVCQEPRFEGGYNNVLLRYADFVGDLAKSEGANLADLNRPVVAVLEKARSIDPELAKKIIPDRVHPGPAGHLIMAEQLLKSWNAPALVSSVEIDATERRLAGSKSAAVSRLSFGNAITWTQLDDALPYPVERTDPVMALTLKSSDFDETLNQQPLKITGLKAGGYSLRTDGAEIGVFDAQTLAAGINLATLDTPMVKQAHEVHALTLEHNNIHFRRWRSVQVPLAGLDAPEVKTSVEQLIKALDREEARLVAEQREKAKPVTRRFELIAR
ncbi:MAG: ThuA domain-containing protein [Verrucomicrobia bacterium]|nr:ThuA domain-containing protein [Verrucomicrobiota bacterium]